jgi:hypothetical protein
MFTNTGHDPVLPTGIKECRDKLINKSGDKKFNEKGILFITGTGLNNCTGLQTSGQRSIIS